jgi:hypothetical protein
MQKALPCVEMEEVPQFVSDAVCSSMQFRVVKKSRYHHAATSTEMIHEKCFVRFVIIRLRNAFMIVCRLCVALNQQFNKINSPSAVHLLPPAL